MSTYRGTVISLCDLTGHFIQPWVEAGYRAVLVDPQHESTFDNGVVYRIADTVEGAFPRLSRVLRHERVVFVAGFPPCTDVSLSGTRWWARKAAADRYFQAKATMVAEQCRTVGALSGAPWFFENPKSAFSRIFGQPQHKFHPWHYTAYHYGDNYFKETWLWAGGGYVHPEPAPLAGLPFPDSRIHAAPPGKDRANFRSATPLGFAAAVYRHNAAVQIWPSD